MAAEKRTIGCRTWAILAILVIAGAIWLVIFAANRVLSLRLNAVHSYALPSPARFLTDSQAVAKATEAIAAEGYDTKLWKPLAMTQSSDPDGNRDKFFKREPTDPAQGVVTFCDSDQASAKNSRIVHVELKGDQVVCRVEMPR